MLPLYIATFAFTTFYWIPHGKCVKSSVYCKVFEDYGTYNISVVLLFFIYQFIIRGCFHKYIPSMLTRIGAGLTVLLFGSITQLLAQVYLPYDSLQIIQQVLLAISYFLILPTAFEFTVAQSPEHMRGMMVGFCYTSLGLGSIFSRIFLILITTWYYYIIVCVLQLLILIIFVILARRYKYRVRENEVNIVQIVDDHYQRYMEQEDEYERHQVTPEDYN
ncbi:PREDICTED: uncharacterized protein LOC109585675 [Amphimedon queenslandica]|nr:PREDICTED: uncharacterized protein LOC109585675 [Amphimedon queenslandica]|eukprot:XP_019857368.1 PREDICTED: uncharacterized protein LOC109585675 [Amphimedon queenslandica]